MYGVLSFTMSRGFQKHELKLHCHTNNNQKRWEKYFQIKIKFHSFHKQTKV